MYFRTGIHPLHKYKKPPREISRSGLMIIVSEIYSVTVSTTVSDAGSATAAGCS